MIGYSQVEATKVVGSLGFRIHAEVTLKVLRMN